MNLIIRKTAFLFFFLGTAVSVSSLTLLIDTRDRVPREEMEIQEKTQVVSLESGIMDVLFEEGHIFFNMYTLQSGADSERSESELLAYAGDLGAAYLLILEPGEGGASWRLSDVKGAGGGGEGFADIDETDQNDSDRERWIELGSLLAEDVITLMD